MDNENRVETPTENRFKQLGEHNRKHMLTLVMKKAGRLTIQ